MNVVAPCKYASHVFSYFSDHLPPRQLYTSRSLSILHVFTVRDLNGIEEARDFHHYIFGQLVLRKKHVIKAHNLSDSVARAIVDNTVLC
jgi:hypothetical protein